MQRIIGLSDITTQDMTANTVAVWLDRIIFVFLLIMALGAPHSISATQIGWIGGMVFWFLRLFFKPRPQFVKTPLNILLVCFFLWSVVSAACSYAPDISFDKLRSVSLLLVFFLVVNNLHTKRAAVFLVFALIFSAMFSVILTPVQRLDGRGVEINEVNQTSFLVKNLSPLDNREGRFAKDGDTITAVNNCRISSPEEVVAEIEKSETSRLTLYRPDYYFSLTVQRADLPAGNTAAERLGFQSWGKSHNWRSAGFFAHYTTYAEVLQLLASLVCGILIVLFRRKVSGKLQLIFGVALAAILLSLLLTVTRASQTAFLVSAIVMVLVAANRKMLLLAAIIILPLAAGALFFLQESRNTGFFDNTDNSITWRQTIYKEGFRLATESPRHMLVGVGMDSVKRFAKDWHLFDDGRLPAGHFHSTPLQLAVERGLPALALWLAVLFFCGKTFWSHLINSRKENSSKDRQSALETGIILGCFGGLTGFFTSGLVHYNLGDSEVAILFYFLTGIGIYLIHKKREETGTPENQPVLPSL